MEEELECVGADGARRVGGGGAISSRSVIVLPPQYGRQRERAGEKTERDRRRGELIHVQASVRSINRSSITASQVQGDGTTETPTNRRVTEEVGLLARLSSDS